MRVDDNPDVVSETVSWEGDAYSTGNLSVGGNTREMRRRRPRGIGVIMGLVFAPATGNAPMVPEGGVRNHENAG